MTLPAITWCTDIHLDHLSEAEVDGFIRREVLPHEDEGGIVILSGDISSARQLTNHLLKFDACMNRPVGFVLGNHDFYGSSVAKMQNLMSNFVSDWLLYLPECYVADGFDADSKFSKQAAATDWVVLGVDGFADGLSGRVDWYRGPTLSDWIYIGELAVASGAGRQALVDAYTRIARAEADKLQERLFFWAAQVPRILLVTHCPPWPHAAWHQGAQSDELYLPWFSSKTVGGTIEMVAQNFPKTKITVLCGHTHGRGYLRVRENVECFTGSAEYGRPEVQDWDWAERTLL